MNSYQVAVAAEAYVAAAFAQAGCDVSVQYGANQPGYDLIAVRGRGFLKISVKGSQDGGWIAAGSYKEKGISYRRALTRWQKDHDPRMVFAFVQFSGVNFGEFPRIYFATTGEVVAHLSKARKGNVSLILHEDHEYVRGVAAGSRDKIPDKWRLSRRRILELFNRK